MYPFLVEIGPLQIPSFGVMVTIGFLISLFVLRRELIRKTFDPALAESLAVAAMVGGMIGAKVYFIFEAFSYFVEDPIHIIFSGAGFTFYGGLIGGAVGVFYVIYRRQLPVLPITDAVALILPLGYAIGRIGSRGLRHANRPALGYGVSQRYRTHPGSGSSDAGIRNIAIAGHFRHIIEAT